MDILKEILIKIGRTDIAKMSDNEVLNLLISISSLLIATLSLAIALIVLFYAAYQFILKRGAGFYGAFSVSSSVWSNQRYVGEVILENTKDKAAAVSAIYLRIGRNIYLELINYSDSPKIIAPFETIKISFREGVSGYISSTFKVDLDTLLAGRSPRKTLIIATPQGISKVKSYKTLWNVYIESLKNHLIVPVHPVRKYHNEKYYSDALQYIITSTDINGQIEEHRLYRGCTYAINGISVITDKFSNIDDLNEFLTTQRTFSHVFKAERAGYSYNDYESYTEIKIKHYGFFGTHILGTIFTKLRRFSFHRKSKNRN
ncbi:hypothetical protein [Pseudomonas simiae]|nr:hypothetical protein [Pseudomonas simiae]MCF5189604.1 hypothetical protein [Pseudomonas simiae]MCF5287798.1 hypothetical protein [Pseudomonas simiae]MCF5335276.1 hypothetical protein [Pseudomonas simiae]MCF5343828.1 hypothetical protein [Pseudomonas simiae]MCF5347186.1 hypothetical protein [Pseudomonas simiae]